jgi:hypothetical protein
LNAKFRVVWFGRLREGVLLSGPATHWQSLKDIVIDLAGSGAVWGTVEVSP